MRDGVGDGDNARTGEGVPNPGRSAALRKALARSPGSSVVRLRSRRANDDETRPAGWDNLGVVAQQDAELVIALLAAPTTMIVCFTITEKGYCRAAEDSLDAELAVVSSVFRWLSG